MARMIRSVLRKLADARCTHACQVDRELIRLQTDLTSRGGWSAAGLQ